jgi:sugar lactone lactonase YvrE
MIRLSRKLLLTVGMIAVAAAFILPNRKPIRRYWDRWFSPPPQRSTGNLQDPEGLAVDAEGNFYVADEDRNELVMLSPEGKVLERIGRLEGYVDGEGQSNPLTRGENIVALAPRHLILVGRHNIAEVKLDPGRPRLVKIIGSRGSGPGQMDGPEGLARDPENGDLYATDEHNRRINIFGADGAFKRSWPVPQDPQSLRVVGDRVYVALNKRNHLVCYSRDGKALFRIGVPALFPYFVWTAALGGAGLGILLGVLKRPRAALRTTLGVFLAGGLLSAGDYVWHATAEGQFYLPDAICLSPDGKRLYIGDRRNGRIQAFDLEGRFLFAFGSKGSGPGELRDPKGIVFDPKGRLVVADSDNHRLQIFDSEGRVLGEIR